MNPLIALPDSNLEALLNGFSSGALKFEITRSSLMKSGISAASAEQIFANISDGQFSAEIISVMIQTILDTRQHTKNVALSQSLVVTGPDTPHTANLKTGSRFIQLIEHARHELMLATFALYQGDQILEPIHQAMVKNPELEVILILNVQRPYGDRTLSEELVEQSRQNFVTRNWPWKPLPRVYYYPASLHLEAKLRASMHAKFLIADEERSFITSANFTEAAQKKNIEIGVELEHSLESKALSHYFKELISRGELKPLLEPSQQAG